MLYILQQALKIAPHIKKNILFLPESNDCDTTSALFRQGKKKFINVLNSTELQQVLGIFCDENACPDDTDEARQNVQIALYGGKDSEETMDSLRFKLFQKSLVKIISI
ncbi:hypothetical protein AVEN_210383-1 [Araneus ventricosus]|uniref:Uncharacterized protein n=1 Tax=Araneus ventricosus TaxID=182803 RepID=A0A4Y2RSN5_ARAVE|nr:hypothetical protein AVEN_210383-1 [Araneus ventricosus]